MSVTKEEMGEFFAALERRIEARNREVVQSLQGIATQITNEYQRMAEETHAAKIAAAEAKEQAAEARKDSQTAMRAVRELEQKIERLTTLPSPPLTEPSEPFPLDANG